MEIDLPQDPNQSGLPNPPHPPFPPGARPGFDPRYDESGYLRGISTGTRLGAMLLDHFIMTAFLMLFVIPSAVMDIAHIFNGSNSMHNMRDSFRYFSLLGIAAYFCKDIFYGRSPAKRILKLQVVDHRSELPASPLQCLVRDLFCVLWPIEAIVALANPQRRIGDFVAGTRLVPYRRPEVAQKSPLAQRLLAIAIMIAIMGGLVYIMPAPRQRLNPDVAYLPDTFNKTESAALNQLFTDSMGKLLTPDIRVYDSVDNRPYKYISLTLELRQNAFGETDRVTEIREQAEALLYDRMYSEIFRGKIRIWYKGDGAFQSSETELGGPASVRPASP